MEKLKTVLAIIGLLMIGYVAGFVSHRQMVTKRFSKVARMGEAPFFKARLIDAIQPNESQQVAVKKILEDHDQRMMKMIQENRQERRAMVNQLEEDLMPILDDSQKERLKEFHRRFKRPPRRGKGHPPGGPPPRR